MDGIRYNWFIFYWTKVAFLYNIYIYFNILSSTMESKGIEDESVEENVSIGGEDNDREIHVPPNQTPEFQ